MTVAMIRPAWQTISGGQSPRVLCICGERLWLTTMVREHWERGCFDVPDPCAGGHDWVTRVDVFTDERENFWTKWRERTWAATVPNCGNDGTYGAIITELAGVFCARPGCGVRASDVLAVVTKMVT